MVRGLFATGWLALIACAVPESWTASGRHSEPQEPVVSDTPGFEEDGSFLVKEDGASPAFLISPPMCTCSGVANSQFRARPTFGIPFTEALIACAEHDPTIQLRTQAPLTDAQRASNYHRVAECLGTRLYLRCVQSASSLDRDPCPSQLGEGWHLPSKQALARLSDSQRRALRDAFSPARDEVFSSPVVTALDSDGAIFAADLSPNGTMALVQSKPPPGRGPSPSNTRANQLFAVRCVRPAGTHPPPPPLSSTAESCLLLASLGKPGQVSERERMTKEAAAAQLARPLYESVVAFRAEADRVRTKPEVDASAIRRELAKIEPDLQRIRDYFRAHEALGPRYFAAHDELDALAAEARTASQERRAEIDRRREEVQREADSLLLANYADDGELRNQGGIKVAIDWLAAAVVAEHHDLAERMNGLRVEGKPVDDLESRLSLLSGLLDEIRAHDPFVWRYR